MLLNNQWISGLNQWKVFSLLCFILCFIIRSTKAAIGDEGSDYVEVRRVLDDIRAASFKKTGVFSDGDPTKLRRPVNIIAFEDGTEGSVNRFVQDDLFETDILLTLPQAKNILKEIMSDPTAKRNRTRNERQAFPPTSSYWKTKTVPYTFQYTDVTWQNLIKKSLKHVEDQTCIRFEESTSSTDYLQFIRGSGCYSSVGRVGGRQQISIGYGCDSVGIISHETLHALGLWHEQSRSDRDTHISILLNNINPGTESNFEKRTPATSENLGEPYDLGSVMHYGSKAFSNDFNKFSIETKDPFYQQTIGQRVGVSFKDAKMINIRYCSNVCPHQLACQKGGYTDPNQCLVCRCPDGYDGTYCQQISKSSAEECKGGEYLARPTLYSITGPKASPGINCFYRIRTDNNQKIEIIINHLSFPCRDACESYLEIKYKEDKIPTGARFCCDVPKTKIISESSEVILIMRGDPSLPSGYTGFQIFFKIDSIAFTTTTETTSETIKKLVPFSSTTIDFVRTTTKGSIHEEYGKWSEWAEWSICSEKCGGCGKRRRVRACYGGNRICSGEAFEIGRCGDLACSVTSKAQHCRGRLLMPCNLINQLDFDRVLNENGDVPQNSFKNRDQNSHLLETPKNAIILRKMKKLGRKKRFVNGNKQSDSSVYCEKRFTYDCPTSLLTINMDWKTSTRTRARDEQLCCSGFYLSEGRCYPN